MKNTITILATFFFLMNVSFANVLTVSNDAAGGAMYPTLLDAYNNATSGQDTLLLEGTNIAYFYSFPINTGWNKNLVVIGIGFNPNKQNPRRTMISFACSNCSNDGFGIQGGGSGSRFYGIQFTQYLQLIASVSNLTFEDCKFDSYFYFANQSASNFVFKNCIFDRNNTYDIYFSSNGITTSNILITNCVFDGYLEGLSNSIMSLTVDHCVFLGTSVVPFQNVQNALIKNNIFMNNATIESGTSTTNTYLNNLSRLGGFPSGTGNIANTNPNFVNYSVGNLYSTGWDFNLQTGSAAIGSASDATDIGVNGGFTNFNESGEVLITPIVRTMIINNTTVAPNGTLNVQINATKPNDQ